MKLIPVVSVLGVVASALGQAVVIGAPTSGTVLSPGQNFAAQLLVFPSLVGCSDVGIALAMASCDNGVCPQPTDRLGSVLYAGPFTPTQYPEGYYQNFSVQVPQSMNTGPATFTLTRFCLYGTGPTPHLEFSDVSLTIE
ncbi:hypothetical protein HD554DRAFT_2330292 [Boletus coccyginus]|nr:hypothetical protein HD554DRAFT_2330292 [Boletus coccyginus]